jgi:mono/diheme cytochrome c family protein
MLALRFAVALLSAISLANPAAAQQASDCYFVVVSFPTKVDFASQIQPIFDARCSSCHQPGSPDFSQHQLDLRTGHAFSALVGVPSTLNPSLDRVHPFVPLKSLLWSKVHCAKPQAGGPMPPAGHALLSDAEQRAIYGWIARGAPPTELSSVEAVPIQPGMSGPWADPSTSSQGFTFEVVEREQMPGSPFVQPSQLIALWFTFNIVPFSGDSEPGMQRWFMVDAVYPPGGTRADGVVRLFHTGWFDDLYSSRLNTVIGSASIVFRSCFEAYLHYDINFDDKPELARSSTIVLRRITPAPFCVAEEE